MYDLLSKNFAKYAHLGNRMFEGKADFFHYPTKEEKARVQLFKEIIPPLPVMKMSDNMLVNAAGNLAL